MSTTLSLRSRILSLPVVVTRPECPTPAGAGTNGCRVAGPWFNSAGMPDPSSIETLRAAVDTVVPRTDMMPGALDARADEHIATLLEQNLPGSLDMLAALLNAYAMEVRAETTFAELSPEERSAVLRAMSTDDSQDIRDVVDALLVFTFGGIYSEWSGYDRATGDLKAPPSWAASGFHGPVHGHPDYRVDG